MLQLTLADHVVPTSGLPVVAEPAGALSTGLVFSLGSSVTISVDAEYAVTVALTRSAVLDLVAA